MGRLRQLFPALVIETAREPAHPLEAAHPSELLAAGLPPAELTRPEGDPLARAAGWSVDQLSAWAASREGATARLAPSLAARLYGAPLLRTSISRLEQFAACPFQFFVAAGLRAEERRRFEADARQRGSFQHEVLRRFHEAAVAEGRRWRDFTPEEARERVGQIARAVAGDFGGGLLADEAGLLTARGLARMLEDFVAALVGWMRHSYRFDPVAAELAFGGPEATLPAWTLPLAGGRRLEIIGKVDRVDVAPGPNPDTRWCAVHDYKSSPQRFDPVLFQHGIQLQLPAYLAGVCDPGGGLVASELAGGRKSRLQPAGMFYANLRGDFPSGKTRSEVLAADDATRKSPYQHRGRFSTAALDVLDARVDGRPGGQFSYGLTREGRLSARSGDALSPEQFAELQAHLRSKLVELADRILAGVVAADPFQKGASLRACDHCAFLPVCRLDPWTHQYRRIG